MNELLTVMEAASLLLKAQGEGAYQKALDKVLTARKSGKDDAERFWQAVAKIIDIRSALSGG